MLEDKQTSVEDESTQVLECNQTFLKPSDILKLCEKCAFKPNSEKDPDIHNQNVHVDSFQCEYCVFAGRNKGSLKTHMWKAHTKIIRGWKFCEYCNFNAKTERERKEHVSELKCTNRNTIIAHTIKDTKDEMLKMKENSYILYTDVKACEEMSDDFLRDDINNFGENPR